MILTPAGPIGQLANLSFFLVAVFGDLLLIRLFLSISYIFLLVFGATGLPRWPQVSSTGNEALDTIIWACLTGSFHLYALIRLVLDERPINFESDDVEQIARFFFRRGGMGPLEAKKAVELGEFRRVKAGQAIMTPSEAVSNLYLLIEGRAVFSTGRDSRVRHGLLLSGHVFDLWLLSLFGIYLGFEKPPGLAGFAAVAETDCLLFYWKLDALNKMAVKMSPALSGAWRNFALCQLGLDMSWRTFTSPLASNHATNDSYNAENKTDGPAADTDSTTTPRFPPSVCSTGEREGPGHILGGRSRDFTDPLRKYEQPRPISTKRFLKWIYRSISPIMPRGIRHNNQPISGTLGRNRIVAFKSAQAKVVYIRRKEQGLATPPEFHSMDYMENTSSNTRAAGTLPSSTSQRDALRQATRLLTAELSWKELEDVSVSDLINSGGFDGGTIEEGSVHGGLGGGGGGSAFIGP